MDVPDMKHSHMRGIFSYFHSKTENIAVGKSERSPGNGYAYVKRSWNEEHESYTCRDGMFIEVPHKSANIRDLDEVKRAPRNQIRYIAGKTEVRITISGIEYDQCMRKIFGGPDDIRTIIFPKMVRTIRQGAFHDVKSLRTAILNEGLETLGTDE